MTKWIPYVYKLTLYKGEETYYYIGCRYASKRGDIAHPDDGYNSSSKVVHRMVKEGWRCHKEILHTFEGSREGAEACILKETELLREADIMHNRSYLNLNIGGAILMTAEVRERMSKAQKGRKHTEAAKRNMSKAQKGRIRTVEHREKISKTLKGRYTGSKSNPYKPFKVVAVSPDGDVTEYVFNGDRPAYDCYDTLGITFRTQSKMKKGEQWHIKHIQCDTRHPFKKGSHISIQLIK